MMPRGIAQGEVMGVRKLKKKHHVQPEGLAFLEDGTMIIADEGRNKRGRITTYELTSPPVAPGR